MNEQTFAEQIAVVQARHHEREKELLKLLRRVHDDAMYWCPFCDGRWVGIDLKMAHKKDCELAKELADD